MFVDVSGTRSSLEALEKAGLNWPVSTIPLTAVGPAGNLIEVTGQQLVYRADTSQPLGVVGNRYRALSNERIFEVADDVAKLTGGAFERAITFKQGRIIALQLLLPDVVSLGKDQVQRRWTIVDARDGSAATLGFETPVRISCMNTLRLAIATAESKVSIHHTLGSQSRLNEAERLVGASNKYFKEFTDMAGFLAGTRYSLEQMRGLVQELVPSKEEPTPQAQRVRGRMLELFDAGLGHEETGIQGTAWAALNAVAEYVDHERNTRATETETADERRTESAYFGTGQTMKDTALTVIRKQIGA